MRDQGSELGWKTAGEFLIESSTRKKINAEFWGSIFIAEKEVPCFWKDV